MASYSGHTACAEVQGDLKAYVDGELSRAGRSGVRRHLDECAECRRELGVIQRLSGELKTLDHATPSPDLRRRIFASLPDEPAPVAPRRNPFRLFGWPAFAPAAVAALAVAWLAVGIWHYQQQGLKTGIDHLGTAGAPRAQEKLAAVRPDDGDGLATGTTGSRKQPASAVASSREARPMVGFNDGHTREMRPTSAQPNTTGRLPAAAGSPESAPSAVSGPLPGMISPRKQMAEHSHRQPQVIARLPEAPAGGIHRDRESLLSRMEAGRAPGPAGPAGPQGEAGIRTDSYLGAKAAPRTSKDTPALATAKPPTVEQEHNMALDKTQAGARFAYGMADRASASQDAASQQVETIDLTVARLDDGARAVKTAAAGEGGYTWPEHADAKDKAADGSVITVVVPRDHVVAVKARLANAAVPGTVNLGVEFRNLQLQQKTALHEEQNGAFGRQGAVGGGLGGFGGGAGGQAQSTQSNAGGRRFGGAAGNTPHGELRGDNNVTGDLQRAPSQNPQGAAAAKPRGKGTSLEALQNQNALQQQGGARDNVSAFRVTRNLAQRRDELKRAPEMVKLIVRLHQVEAPAAAMKAGAKR